MRAHQAHTRINVFSVATLIADAASAWHPPRQTKSGGAPRHAESASRDGWLDRLDRWVWTRRQRRIDAQLARSPDVYELEARMRDLERATPSRYY